MRDVSFGQYYPVDALVHRLDPRNKLVMAILYIVSLFFIQTFTGFGIVALALLTPLLCLYWITRGTIQERLGAVE